MIFAAGYGSRLKPWTDHDPKALVEVAGKPMLGHVIEKMLCSGIDRIIVNTHHFAEKVDDYLRHSEYSDNVTISHEDVLLDTGGGLAKVIPLIGDSPVLLHNADIMTDFDLRSMQQAFHDSDCDALLLTAARPSARFLVLDAGNRMTRHIKMDSRISPDTIRLERAGEKARAFGGVHIVSPTLYPLLTDYSRQNPIFSIMDIYKKYCSQYKLMSWDTPADACWFDVGRPETLTQANQYFQSK